jgi:hypothetical protein
MDWASDGEERNLCQLTHPERVHEFLRKWPGLLECSRANPGVLAMYAPQLTIPGFDDGFANVFDALLDPRLAVTMRTTCGGIAIPKPRMERSRFAGN